MSETAPVLSVFWKLEKLENFGPSAPAVELEGYMLQHWETTEGLWGWVRSDQVNPLLQPGNTQRHIPLQTAPQRETRLN